MADPISRGIMYLRPLVPGSIGLATVLMVCHSSTNKPIADDKVQTRFYFQHGTAPTLLSSRYFKLPTENHHLLICSQQVLCQHAQTIAQQYEGGFKSTYLAAADNLRIPYWDWASVSSIPDIVNKPTVQINTPSGVQTVSNPLYQYKFQNFPLNPSWFPPNQDGDLNTYPETVRSPDYPGGPSDFSNANYSLSIDNLKSRTVSSQTFLKPG
jgi:hypothetical protein